MKLGTETGSFTNYLLSGTNGQPKPVVGMGATRLMWTDRHPVTIVEVSKDYKVVVIQRDNAERIDDNGMSECQDYEFTPNSSKAKELYKLNKHNRYMAARLTETGRYVFVSSNAQLRIGERDKYHDFSF